MYKFSALLLSFFLYMNLSAQQKYPTDYFGSPVEFRILLSGTFGELRSSHFHSGIDIKTQGVEGKNIHAVADGYISRISVAGTGFGKALYVSHPNGYTSVYGHLSAFSDSIGIYVKSQQYKKEQFTVNLYPPRDMFVVKKGEIIAKSGNSGGSDGAHLHFEIRDSRNEIPINPLLFGFKVKDLTRPRILGLRFYPVKESSSVNYRQKLLDVEVNGWGLNHKITKYDTLQVSGKIGFGINVYDMQDDSNNKNGVYSIQLWIDSTLVYSHHLEKFSFDETKYINSFIDYAEFIQHKKRYQRSIIDPGNRLSIYDEVLDQGTYNFTDSSYHKLKYELKDAAGNISQLTGVLKSNPPKKSNEDEVTDKEGWFVYNSENKFETDSIKLDFDKGTFYRSFKFDYQKDKAPKGSYSALHKIHTENFPVHKSYEIKMAANKLPKQLHGKALIAQLNKDGVKAVGGFFTDGFVVGKASNFGNFMVVVDTIRPKITPLNIHNGKNIATFRFINFLIKDELSGIRSYRATLNNQWILMDYDPKNDKLSYQIDDRMKKGKNQFRLEVKDAKDNTAVYEAEIEY
ncbi:MAG: M23 family peptidase [Bacteroidetes bacterium HGW-Bacteroidetes-17]|nr:MAG: M23 family peptidase [Bacteroidetes bacterium HGW-Bacteroidetes-17]